jgi:predicted nucleic acid-binding protein
MNLVNVEIRNLRSVLLTPQVIAEFLHIITDPRRFQNPLSMTDALVWIEDFLQQPGVRLPCLPNIASPKRIGWMKQFGLGRKRILDTSLAASFHAAGCTRILTSNPDDFSVFQVFETVVP